MMALPLIAGMGLLYLARKKGLVKARSEMTSMERKEADKAHRLAVDQTVILALGEKIDSLQNTVDYADETIRVRDETYDKQLKKEREATEEVRKQLTRMTEEAARLKAHVASVEKENARLGVANAELQERVDNLLKVIPPGKLRRARRSQSSGAARA